MERNLNNKSLRLHPYKNCDAKYIISWIHDEISFAIIANNAKIKYL